MGLYRPKGACSGTQDFQTQGFPRGRRRADARDRPCHTCKGFFFAGLTTISTAQPSRVRKLANLSTETSRNRTVRILDTSGWLSPGNSATRSCVRRSETALADCPKVRGSDGNRKLAQLMGALRPCGGPIAVSRHSQGTRIDPVRHRTNLKGMSDR